MPSILPDHEASHAIDLIPKDKRMVDCPECNGTGVIEFVMGSAIFGDPWADYGEEECDRCEGTGEIEDEEE